MNRKEFISDSAIATTGLLLAGNFLMAQSNGVNNPLFTQKPLPYAYNALEPHIDELTMQIHYSKHHAAYVKNLNDALSKVSLTPFTTLEELLANVSKFPVAVRNNGGGHFNHEMFWNVMKPGGSVMPSKVIDALIGSFGSVENFKKQFTDAAKTRFGSGWAWLVKNEKGLSVGSTPNQDNPLMDVSELKGTPLLCLDVWEHAYYLKYQNLRGDYINNWWNLVNWDQVASKL